MSYDLPERVVKDFVTFAKRYSVRKVIDGGGDRLGIESRGWMQIHGKYMEETK